MDRFLFLKCNNIKYYRVLNNLSQAELAQIMGCSRNFISNLENNICGCSAIFAYRLCLYFNVSFEDLFCIKIII